VPGDRRTVEEIRREITTEREQLVNALADLREGIAAKSRLAAVVGAALAVGLAAAAAVTVVRRLKRK
jgi:hypothetical protein